ncbi:type I polyketide synthase [Streptomyces sp. FR-108]|uniref:type I polyketide synthase n=1 Tax=Streptomyces sp. FR-108 TaxID=3416665 RepID=UPI003CEEC48B
MSGETTDIAVVGMACRFPGVRDLDAFWHLLLDGKSTVGTFPEQRAGRRTDQRTVTSDTARHPDAATVASGSFFDSVDGFDARFFGTGPAEATAMDPAQRLGLELAWEAVENARLPAGALAGRRIDVLVGAAPSGYDAVRRLSGADRDDHYAVLGSGSAWIANRISALFDVRGLSLCADSGQSSSLVSLALACDRIRSGAVDMAMVGGVNLIIDPDEGVGLANLGALSAEGRCFAFDERADGFVRGEGGAFVLLKRRDLALDDGDHLYAVVRGWDVAHGGASSRIPDPSPGAQAATVLAALGRAAVAFDGVDYVEAHGTGTRLGDPAEMAGLREVFRGTGRSRRLTIGSVKTNVGHLEQAAGIVGFVKAALCLDRAHLVPSLNFRSPNPAVPDFLADFEVPVTARPWPSTPDRPRRAGVSAFGMGGTNAHLILEQAPRRPGRACPRTGEGPAAAFASAVPGALPWVLSARSEPALREQAARLRDFVAADTSPAVADVGHSLVSTRTVFEHRAVVLGAQRGELTAGLAGLAAGEPDPRVVKGTVPAGGAATIGFLFAGQGAQRAGMGRELHAASPVFAAALDRACGLLESELGLPVAEVLLGEAEAGAEEEAKAKDKDRSKDRSKDERADRTVYAQAGLFAMEVGLLALLAAVGIGPDAVAGHSMGEITAAYAAGVLSLEDACALVATRGRLMQALPAGGAMFAVQASEEEITAAAKGRTGVSVAALNGPSSVVVSGDTDAVERVASGFRDQGRRTRRLRVSHAFHSHRMDPVLDELGRTAARLRHAAPGLAWVSALTGEVMTAPGPEYWARQARHPVRYADAVAALAARGVSVFIEVGPDETLSGMGAGALDDPEGKVFVPLLRPGRPAPEAVAAGLAEAFAHGAPVDWAAVSADGRRAALPTYAFQRERYWMTAPQDTDNTDIDTATATNAGTGRGSGIGAVVPRSERSVLKLVCSETVAVLGARTPAPTGDDLIATRSDDTFKDLGFDSAMAVRLRNRLTAAAGVRLPATVAFTYPTPRTLGRHVFTLLGAEASDIPEPVAEPDQENERRDDAPSHGALRDDEPSDEELYESIERGYV